MYIFSGYSGILLERVSRFFTGAALFGVRSDLMFQFQFQLELLPLSKTKRTIQTIRRYDLLVYKVRYAPPVDC